MSKYVPERTSDRIKMPCIHYILPDDMRETMPE
jgi:hypothetical protein